MEAMRAQAGESGSATDAKGGAVDWAARWVAKFRVYHQRRFGAGTEVTPAQVADFARFIAVRWRVPEWQQQQAEAALRKHFGFPQEPPSPGAQTAPDPAEPRAGTAGSSAPGSTTTDPGAEAPTPRLTLAQALLKLEGAILVRHYSVRTQETKCDIRTVQELLGHQSVETTQIYTHVMTKPRLGVKSPLDG